MGLPHITSSAYLGGEVHEIVTLNDMGQGYLRKDIKYWNMLRNEMLNEGTSTDLQLDSLQCTKTEMFLLLKYNQNRWKISLIQTLCLATFNTSIFAFCFPLLTI